MKNATPYLFFNGNCRQALDFYKKVFGGELHVMTYADAPKEAGAGNMPEEMKSKVMHAKLTRGNFGFMASDTTEGANFGDNVYLCVDCESVAEIETLFKSLSEKGKVEMPLNDTFWGARFGTITDQFGIGWMLNFQK